MLGQLQHIVTDSTCQRVIDLYAVEKVHLDAVDGTGGGPSQQRLNAEQAYQRKAEHLLSDDNCFKMTVVSK